MRRPITRKNILQPDQRYSSILVTKLINLIKDGRATADDGKRSYPFGSPAADPKAAPQCRLDITTTAFGINDAMALDWLEDQECEPIL